MVTIFEASLILLGLGIFTFVVLWLFINDVVYCRECKKRHDIYEPCGVGKTNIKEE